MATSSPYFRRRLNRLWSPATNDSTSMTNNQSNNDDALINRVKEVFGRNVPFHDLLNLQVAELTFDSVSMKLDMREQLVGNSIHGILHGGVISAVLDVTGGLGAFMSLLGKMSDIPDSEKLRRLAKFSTINLRIDYLTPGRGEHFVSRAKVLRTGNRVTTAQMELHNDQGDLIAVGTGTYSSV